MSARFAGATARVNGTVRLAREPSADLRFELAAESLEQAAAGAAGDPLSMSGNYAGSRDKLEVKNLSGPNRRDRDIGVGVDGRSRQEAGGNRTLLRPVWI